MQILGYEYSQYRVDIVYSEIVETTLIVRLSVPDVRERCRHHAQNGYSCERREIHDKCRS